VLFGSRKRGADNANIGISSLVPRVRLFSEDPSRQFDLEKPQALRWRPFWWFELQA